MLTLVKIVSITAIATLSFMAAPAHSQSSTPNVKINEKTDGRYVIDVTLHTAKEIEALLDRAEKLYESSNSNTEIKYTSVGIALVLHGDEIKLFDKKNYKQNKKMVDKAAKLDANNIIEIKICNTKMRELGLEKKDMPPFVETVPFGPDEIERLKKKGYLYL